MSTTQLSDLDLFTKFSPANATCIAQFPADRRADFARSVNTAIQHIPIAKKCDINPGPFAIVDHGNRFAVYDLDDFQHGQATGGFLPPGKITGTLVATVDLEGVLKLANALAA